MKLAIRYANIAMGILIYLLILNMTLISQLSYAESAQAICERPVFKLWKAQQSNRLWEPGEETQVAERTGSVFTYNCFTEAEIDVFFANYEDRIENAHFYPILSHRAEQLSESEDEDDDEC